MAKFLQRVCVCVCMYILSLSLMKIYKYVRKLKECKENNAE